VALHHLIFSGTLAAFPELKLMAVHGGGFLPGYSGRIGHIAAVKGMDGPTMQALAGGNAIKALGLRL
jgi:hypothetical protein